MDTLLQDLRYAARALRRAPGFTLAAALSLAVGIGATTALFSAVNGVLLEPLPLPHADRVVFTPRQGDTEADVGVPDLVDLRARATSFTAIAGFAPDWAYDLTGLGEPERLTGAVVESSFFAVLGLEPLRGRLSASPTTSRARRGWRCWRRRSGAGGSAPTRRSSAAPSPCLAIPPRSSA